MHRLPRVAIPVRTNYWTAPQCPFSGNGSTFRSLPEIMAAVRQAGGEPVPVESGVPSTALHAVILPGGSDLHPGLYGEEPHPSVDLEWVDEAFDRFQLDWARWALEQRVPVLGICRGMQVLNVAAGGTLIQDVPSSGTHLDHAPRSVLADPRLRPQPVHPISVDLASELGQLLRSNRLQVNSIHHQSVARIGDGFRSVAWADDGVVEAIERCDASWQRGVQFHPEDMRREPQFQRLFDSLVAAAG